jgi:hypothetical protein
MRYVCIPLPLVTGGKPGIVYYATLRVKGAVRDAARE